MESRTAIFSRRKVNTAAKLHSRSGSLLILVLVIMGVAMILITSALSITMAARKHYYDNALTSQSNLTATSVAKTLGAAVASGDITTAELETLAAAGKSVKIPVTSSAATINASSSGNNSVAPGLSGQTTGTSTSKTTAAFSYYPDSTSKTYIKLTVTTELRAAASTNVERNAVSVLFKKDVSSGNAGAFANEITLGVSGSGVVNNLPQILIGSGPPASGASNYVVAHGDLALAGSGGNIYTADMIVTDHVTFGASTTLKGNLILAGDGAAINNDGSGSFTVNNYMLVLGTTSTSSMFFPGNLTGGGSWSVLKAIYVTNKTMINEANWGNLEPTQGIIGGANSTVNYSWASSKSYKVAPTSSVTINSVAQSTTTDAAVLAVAAAAKAEADKYTAVLTNNVTRTVLTSAEAFAEGYSGYATPLAVRNAVTAGTVTRLTAEMLAGTTPIPEAATYCIDLATGTTSINGTAPSGVRTPTILTFDISSFEKTIYVIGSDSQVLTIGELGLINFVRTSGSNFGKIVLLGGCDLELASNNSGDSKNDSGIIGSTHNAAPSAAARTTYVAGNPIFLYIYGMGESPNKISMYTGCTLEGYIGLYGPSGEIYGSGGGMVPAVYARYEGAKFTNGGGDPLTFPYAPLPGNSFTPGGSETSIPPKYAVTGFLTEA